MAVCLSLIVNRPCFLYSLAPVQSLLVDVWHCSCMCSFIADCYIFVVTVCETVHPVLSDSCLSCPLCLSVTLVYCGQTVGWTPKKGHSSPPPIFGPCLLWPNGWMNQDTTWYRGRPRPRRHCLRSGPSSPPWKGAQQPLTFQRCLLWPNSCPSQQLLSSCLWSPYVIGRPYIFSCCFFFFFFFLPLKTGRLSTATLIPLLLHLCIFQH